MMGGVWDQLRQNPYWPWWKKDQRAEPASSTVNPSQLSLQRPHASFSSSSSSSSSSSMTLKSNTSGLLALPSEIIHQILLYLPGRTVAAISATCHRLHSEALNDLVWASLVRQNVPLGTKLTLTSGFNSWRSLYITHYPYWFLAKHKIWFSDSRHTGKLLLARFDPRTGNIEAYRVLSEQGTRSHEFWEWDDRVSIHFFQPRVRLFLDNPVIVLDRTDPSTLHNRQAWWEGELRMPLENKEREGLYSTFFLARSMPPQLQDPSMALWPPRIIPSEDRVRNESRDGYQGWGHKPQKASEISETTFRIRNWLEFGNPGNIGVRIGEEVNTYATVSPECYTPTEAKPYQGIWVGDYSGHGCEFILIIQPDGGHISSDGIRRQRLEGIKLTGDPNVPRGEYTFIADDIGPGGLLRVAEEEIFRGARIVKSRGHIAGRDFQNDAFISSQLILITRDKIAQYWEEFGHVSFYERIDIDQLLKSGLS